MGSSFTPPQEARTIAELGPERVMWGSDFPHDEGTFPHTTEALRHSFHDWDEDLLHDLLGRTCAQVYGLDHDELAALGIGPQVDAIAAPLTTVPTSTSLAFRDR